jgi:hypothetical protein
MGPSGGCILSADHTIKEETMTTKGWKLQPGIKIEENTAGEIAKIALALKSLALYATLELDQDECPEDLKQVVDEGVAAIDKVFAEE